MAVALILLLVAVASVLFHIFSPWWWTPLASNWGYIDDTITLTFWITGAVFFAVVAFMAYCVFRFRHTEGRQAAYNPVGLNPGDPAGQDDVVIQNDDLHLPVGKPVKVLLRSIDVLHDFYVPEFRAKMDMIPGSVTYYWFTPTRTGTFEVLCAELCGAAHAQMRSKVIVEEEKEYHAWLEKQHTFAELSGQRNVAKAAYKSGSE